MKTKLWQTGDMPELHPIVEAFTVGNDRAIDQELLGYDITASIAHATMLGNTNLIPKEESRQLVKELRSLLKRWQHGLFAVSNNDEDGHSAIETYLTTKLGDIGKKIHTGRSRNDQPLVMIRLYLLEILKNTANQLQQLKKSLVSKAQ